MTRCTFCRRFIWFWQSRGWYVWGADGSMTRWHALCAVKAAVEHAIALYSSEQAR